MGRIVGIDLGTSTSEVAILVDGKPFVIPNHLGEDITPSVVGISEEGEVIVGKEARDQLLLKPNDTVIEVKRLMGSNQTVSMGGKEYSPQKISSYILRYLIDCSSKYLGEEVERAVITVPAYFSDDQRKSVVEAGKLAGITVERIINEPTAASLDYGIEHMEECRNILVYDLGGGTLDVTILEMFEGVLEVKASSGNNKLGGKDFDQKIIDYLFENFKNKNNTDISKDIRAMMRLKDAAENCKIALSSCDKYEVALPFLANVNDTPVALEEKITKEVFESLINELIDSTQKQIEVALSDSGLKSENIDMILLVGGSTRIPYVKKFIEKTLGQIPQSLVDPDLAVVRGAAVQAAILNDELSSEKDIMITDVCPYTLGLAVLDFIGGMPVHDAYDVIIPRNVTIPVRKEKIYGTVVDNQTSVEIKAYQGEYKRASQNNFLGKFKLDGIPPAPAFEQKINVAFSYDVNGILSIEGKIVSTGEKANLTVETTGVSLEDEVNLEDWVNSPLAKKYRAVIKKAERLLKTEDDDFEMFELENLLVSIKKSIIKNDDTEIIDNLKDEISDLLMELSEDEDD
ncbi:MAG: Hsp70 family protein [Clostridiales bacterium]|nr:Hsp70 family protein [Clostridiales bacterium]